MEIKLHKLNHKIHRYQDTIFRINLLARYETFFQVESLTRLLNKMGVRKTDITLETEEIVNPDFIYMTILPMAIESGEVQEEDLTPIFAPFPMPLWQDGIHDIYVVCNNNEKPTYKNIVGYCFFTFLDRDNKNYRPVMTQIYVLPKYRGNGVAKLLLSFAIEDKGYSKIYVECPNQMGLELIKQFPSKGTVVEVGEFDIIDNKNNVHTKWIKHQIYF